MHVVSIYNNKSALGKSTLTVCLADVLRSRLREKGTCCSAALVRLQAPARCWANASSPTPFPRARPIGRLAAEVLQSRRIPTLAKYLVTRPSVNAKAKSPRRIFLLGVGQTGNDRFGRGDVRKGCPQNSDVDAGQPSRKILTTF